MPLHLSGMWPFGEDYTRFLRGAALLALGNDDEALRWLENGFDATPDEMAFRAQVSLRPLVSLRPPPPAAPRP